MSSAATSFVHATLKSSQKVPRAKSGTFWFPKIDSHDSSTSCVALQYKTGTKFFHRAVLPTDVWHVGAQPLYFLLSLAV